MLYHRKPVQPEDIEEDPYTPGCVRLAIHMDLDESDRESHYVIQTAFVRANILGFIHGGGDPTGFFSFSVAPDTVEHTLTLADKALAQIDQSDVDQGIYAVMRRRTNEKLGLDPGERNTLEALRARLRGR